MCDRVTATSLSKKITGYQIGRLREKERQACGENTRTHTHFLTSHKHSLTHRRPPLPPTHTHTHTHTQTHTHTDTHTQTHTHTDRQTDTHTHTRAHCCACLMHTGAGPQNASKYLSRRRCTSFTSAFNDTSIAT